MAKKRNTKVPKAGHPAKRAAEVATLREAEKARIATIRDHRKKERHLKETGSKPRNVGGFYQPPEGLEAIPNESMPVPLRAPKKAKTKKSKAESRETLKKAGVGIVVFSALGALVFSILAPAVSSSTQNNAPALDETTQNQMIELDENGNRILVDSSGNPIGGAAIGKEATTDKLKVDFAPEDGKTVGKNGKKEAESSN